MLRLDDLQNGYRIYQDPELFCFGVDAVLLAHYPKLRQGDKICDLCTGFLPVPLIIKAEAEKAGLQVHITGLEIQEQVVKTARKSIAYNHLENEIAVVNGDLKEAADLFGAASFSLVTCNPPYMKAESGLVGANQAKAIARTELSCTLRDVTESASKLLIPGGRFAMIHRPFRLPEIFEEMKRVHLEPKRMRLICPFADAEPTMVLIEATRGGRSYLHVDPPLIIYGRDRSYTEEVLQMYGRLT
jgi:tRNA1Val (adenine37-N6)-methyltransferase